MLTNQNSFTSISANKRSFEADKRDFGFIFLPAYMGCFQADKRDFGFMFLPGYIGVF